MDLANLTITKGQALVLVGPQGCGKSTTARTIAKKHGPFVEIEADQLTDQFQMGNALAAEPKTVIVEGPPKGEKATELVKTMLTSDTVAVHRKGAEPRLVKTPNFIFCSGHTDFIPAGNADRRFFVVRMDEKDSQH